MTLKGEGSWPSGEGSGRALAWSDTQPRGPAHSHTFRDVCVCRSVCMTVCQRRAWRAVQRSRTHKSDTCTRIHAQVFFFELCPCVCVLRGATVPLALVSSAILVLLVEGRLARVFRAFLDVVDGT